MLKNQGSTSSYLFLRHKLWFIIVTENCICLLGVLLPDSIVSGAICATITASNLVKCEVCMPILTFMHSLNVVLTLHAYCSLLASWTRLLSTFVANLFNLKA